MPERTLTSFVLASLALRTQSGLLEISVWMLFGEANVLAGEYSEVNNSTELNLSKFNGSYFGEQH